MIPAEFDYVAPTSVDEAVAALHTDDPFDEVKVLAGGHSLIPVLKLRLAAPQKLVDISKVPGLSGVADTGDVIQIGAMTTHHEVATNPVVREHALLLAEAAQTIADPQVRHRGTIGGASAHADPAGDLPAPLLALGAEFVIAGPSGVRAVPADEFFVDLFTTAIGADEILTKIVVPKHTGWGASYEKFVRVAQQWSIVAVAATVKADGGTIGEAKVALTNVGQTPVRATAFEQALAGTAATEDAVKPLADQVGEGLEPPSDTNGSAAYRRHLAGVLARRAVLAAADA